MQRSTTTSSAPGPTTAQDGLAQRVESGARAWLRRVDRLLAAFDDEDRERWPAMRSRLEAMRHRRDTLATKLHAFRRRQSLDRRRVLGEVESAQHELRSAWRIVVRALENEAVADER